MISTRKSARVAHSIRWLLWLLPVLALAQDNREAVSHLIILAIARQPESVDLARFYAAQRGVPADNIVALPMPVEESITWRQYHQRAWRGDRRGAT